MVVVFLLVVSVAARVAVAARVPTVVTFARVTMCAMSLNAEFRAVYMPLRCSEVNPPGRPRARRRSQSVPHGGRS